MGRFTRREFLLTTGTMVALGSTSGRLAAAGRPLPRRKLGRTGVEVGVIGLGLGPLGLAGYPARHFEAVVRAALDEGVSYLDTQPDYGESEAHLAPILRSERDRVFLVTKTSEKSKQAVLRSIQGSLARLGTPFLDAALLNNVGGYGRGEVFGRDAALAGLAEARRQGLVRFLGVSGHVEPARLAEVVRSGEIDVVMAPFNFVDRHTYRFEQEVLPAAAEHEVGVVAMKTLGGAVGLKYDSPEQRALLPARDHGPALRYVLGVPQVCVAVVGCKTVEEVRRAAAAGHGFHPLSKREETALLARGAALAAKWGQHLPGG